MFQVLNSKGEPIVLNAREQLIADYNQRLVNGLGFDIDITTLTTIIKKVSEQKFFQVAPADYLPLRVGNGAWSQQLTTYRSFQLGGAFEEGIVNTGGNNGRLASADSGVDALNVKVVNWAKSIGWTLMDIQMAAKSGNWDLITAKEKARKTNWDLGIQKIAFLGSDTDAGVLGLLTQNVTPNTSLITKKISSMSTAELKVFLAGLLDAYRTYNNRTAYPTHFIIPESDYLGLASPAAADFPIRSTLDLLLETLKVMTGNPGFKVLPLAYADTAYNSIGKTRYTLLNYDEESIRMDLPVDYTNTLANSTDNFSFQNVGYGQYTGALAYRPLEILYFDF